MKIRNGFVSNSSSSSFIIGIVGINEEQLGDVKPLIQYTDIQLIPTEEAIKGTGYTWPELESRETSDNKKCIFVEHFDVEVSIENPEEYDYVAVYSTNGADPSYTEYGNSYDALFTKKQLNITKWIREQGGQVEAGIGYDG